MSDRKGEISFEPIKQRFQISELCKKRSLNG